MSKQVYFCVTCHYRVELNRWEDALLSCEVCQQPKCPDCKTHLVRIIPVEEEISCKPPKSSV